MAPGASSHGSSPSMSEYHGHAAGTIVAQEAELDGVRGGKSSPDYGERFQLSNWWVRIGEGAGMLAFDGSADEGFRPLRPEYESCPINVNSTRSMGGDCPEVRTMVPATGV